MKVDLTYGVQINISRPAMLAMWISGDRGSFAVTTANMRESGETTVFFRDGDQVNWVTYHESTFEYRTQNLPIENEFAWLFPWDDFSTPQIYFWANFTIYPELRIVSSPPQGYVWNLESLGPVSATRVAAEIPPLTRMFLGPPPEGVQAIAFRITLLRETGPFLICAFYEAVGIMGVWSVGAIIWAGVAKPNERLQAGVSLVITVLFSWSFRQMFSPPFLTLAEISVVVIAFLWLLVTSDVLRHVKLRKVKRKQ